MVEFDYEANRHRLIDSRGVRITAGLFKELADGDSSFTPTFSLADWRKTYVEVSDPTDYRAAKVLIGNWDHWLMLMQVARFAEEVKKWRIEVEVKLRSEAILSTIKHSKSIGGTAAAKWLAEGGYTSRDKRKKADKEEEAAIAKETKSKVKDDAERLGLSVVK